MYSVGGRFIFSIFHFDSMAEEEYRGGVVNVLFVFKVIISLYSPNVTQHNMTTKPVEYDAWKGGLRCTI